MRNLTLVLMMLVLSACNGFKSEKTPAGPVVVQEAGLQGRWGRTQCQLGGPGEDDMTFVNTFSGNRFNSTIHYYTSTGAPCSNLSYIMDAEYTFATAPSLVAPNAREINSILVKVTVIVADPLLAADFNADAKFGYTNWVVNQPTVFTTFDPQYFRTADYDLIQLANGILYWGDTSGGRNATSPALRPIRIDWTNSDYPL